MRAGTVRLSVCVGSGTGVGYFLVRTLSGRRRFCVGDDQYRSCAAVAAIFLGIIEIVLPGVADKVEAGQQLDLQHDMAFGAQF